MCIFCGARSGRDRFFAEVAAQTARAVVAAGFGIVYGGGRVGLMGTVADAALAEGGEVIGVIPESLANTEVAHDGLSALHVVKTMHERKALMAELSDAFIALPGGFGTMDEFHEMLTWQQLGIHDKQIGLLNTDGFYDPLLALYDRMRADGFMTAATQSLFVTANTADDLLARISLARAQSARVNPIKSEDVHHPADF